MGLRLFGRDNLDRHRRDLDRVGKEMPRFEAAPALVLGKVTQATVFPSNPYRWTYTVAEAWMSGTNCVTRPNGITMTAYSVSELGNPATLAQWFSYGVDGANLPGGWVPVQIPVGTPVILSAHRRADGSLVWLIINTQAIDGTCDPG